jgi:CHAT domain-containing protein
LTHPFEKHLDDDEIDALVPSSARSVGDGKRLDGRDLGEVSRHVESCQDCAQKVQMHKLVQNEISRLAKPSEVQPGPDCITDMEWFNVVAGMLPETKTKELMKHAAQCGHCGPLLKTAAETLSDETTQDQENMLASLRSARPEWQRAIAETMQISSRGRESGNKRTSWLQEIFSWPRTAFAVAAFATIMIAGWLGFRLIRPPSAEQLLAQAYTDRRTIEVRIPGAKYAPMRVDRGSGGSSLDKPPSLLKAEALIGDQLTKSPNDPDWLQAKARADLLDGNFESAIQTLQRALETEPDSPSLLTDLGSAYFERAEKASRPIDYGNAIESLGKALAKSPDDPVALFNRALACERMFLFTQAVDDWEHYLRVDPHGEWSAEALQRLNALKQNLQKREKSLAEPLLTPSDFAKPGADNEAMQVEVDRRIENYLHVALTDWLPQAFPDSSGKPSLEARFALSELAAITRNKHDDMWLTDLLSSATSAQFPSGIKALAASLRAGDRGDYAEDQVSARRAVQLFRVAANRAGQLRAQAEEVYSDHLLWEGPRCLASVRSIDEPLKSSSYTWLQAQMSLEESNCADLVGDLGTYQAAIGRGTHQAEVNNYTALFLRGLGFQAQAAASLGDANSGFSLVARGLALFWSGEIDLMKGYNFYTDLDTAADDLHLANLQVAIWREATALIDRHPNVLQRAMAHRWYASSAYLANMPGVAESEFAKASALFAASPQTAATARDRMDAEIWLATIETRQGDLKQAETRLQSVQPTLAGTPGFDPEIGYYTAQSDIQMRQSDSASAEPALRSAIFLAEWALNSFPSETDRRKWADQTRNAYRNAVEWKLRAGDPSSALELWEWYLGARLRASEQTARHLSGDLDTANPPDLSEAPPLPSPTAVAKRLPLLHDQTAIVYGIFPDGIAVWIYDDRGIYSQWIAEPAQQVQDLTVRFRRLCSDPASDPAVLRATARSLYDLLVSPIESRLAPGRTLMIEPDDFLASVPFDALVDPSGQYFVERTSLVISPGLYRQMSLRPAAAITRQDHALVISVPTATEEGLASLSDAEDEARTVAARFSSAHWLQSNKATLSAIQSEIRFATVFHFAGHAVSSPSHSGLVLAELDPNTQRARLVDSENISSKPLPHLQLAVLSACNTGTDDEALGSGTESLSESLLRAGTPHVIASRWNVDSTQTAYLMNIFYAHLLAGEGPANSLRTAQLVLAARPASAHPYYWSAFKLEGVK